MSNSKAVKRYRFADALAMERRWREVENIERALKAIYTETRDAVREYRHVVRG